MNRTPDARGVYRSRVRLFTITVPRLSAMPPETDTARRDRLNYWIKKGMERQGFKEEAAFARAIRAPASTVNRWLSPKMTAVPSLIWLGAICRTLKLDPMLFALLPAIPDDALAPFALDAPLATVTDAERLALLDTAAEEESRLGDELPPVGRPRTRPRRAGPRCPLRSPDR